VRIFGSGVVTGIRVCIYPSIFYIIRVVSEALSLVGRTGMMTKFTGVSICYGCGSAYSPVLSVTIIRFTVSVCHDCGAVSSMMGIITV
jgi:hypothetical protein